MLKSPIINWAQQWVDTAYNYELFTDISYGSSTNFAGKETELTMDIAVPEGDTIPLCGRPLLVAVHGGAFMLGSKADPVPQKWMKGFAKRGYVTASVNYRLGMIQTNNYIHCNITQIFNTPWDCSNMQDTTEWYRAYFRAIQDVKGAIRFLVNKADQYQIDSRNVFVVGESAGGFIALGSAFLDTEAEKLLEFSEVTDAVVPNTLYNSCIQPYGLTVDSLNTTRPDLGDIKGSLNPSILPYQIKGVGSFYGGMFQNLFLENNDVNPPAIYLFHQPNDLIVPYDYQQVLAGYAYCTTFFGCQYIVNRPFVYGGKGIKNLIDDLATDAPDYIFDSTNNNADCNQQILNPALGGHQLDNYWLRSLNMAEFFATKIDGSDGCITSILNHPSIESEVRIYPNPSFGNIVIDSGNKEKIEEIALMNSLGQLVFSMKTEGQDMPSTINFPRTLKDGVYYLILNNQEKKKIIKIIIHRR